MVERADQRQLVKQVGGVFRLCSIIQKRMRELVMGARPLVELDEQDRGDLLSIVLHEIQEGKVGVAEEGEVGVDFEFTKADVTGLADSIDLDELKSVVADDDLDIVLPGEEEEEEEEEGARPEPHPAETVTPVRDHELDAGLEDETLAAEPADEELPVEPAMAGEDEAEEEEEDEAKDE